VYIATLVLKKVVVVGVENQIANCKLGFVHVEKRGCTQQL